MIACTRPSLPFTFWNECCLIVSVGCAAAGPTRDELVALLTSINCSTLVSVMVLIVMFWAWPTICTAQGIHVRMRGDEVGLHGTVPTQDAVDNDTWRTTVVLMMRSSSSRTGFSSGAEAADDEDDEDDDDEDDEDEACDAEEADEDVLLLADEALDA